MSDEKKTTKAELVKSQSNYKGNSHFDYVDIEIVKDGDYYKKGDKDRVHPSLAEILKAKGLIDSVPTAKSRDTDKLLTDVEVVKINEGEKEF